MIEFPSYKNDMFGFPSDTVDPKEKVGKDWCMQFAKAIYSYYLRGYTGICYNDVDRFYELRAYGNGTQDPNIYKDWLLGKNKKGPHAEASEHVRKGYMNVNWDILAIAPNFKSVVSGTFEEVDHDVYADGVDEMSSQTRENAKWNLWFEKEFASMIQEFQMIVGPTGEPPSYVPKTIEELNMFSEMGGFKLKSEVSIEAGINYTLWLSEWKEIKRKLFEDLFDLGIAGVRDYVDPQTQKVQARYCDVPRCIIPYSKATDYRNMPFAGEFVDYTISEIRALGLFDETQLAQLANLYAGKWGNRREAPNGWYYRDDNIWWYDDFKITALDCEYKSSDSTYTTKRVNKRGQELAYNSKFGKVYDREDRKTVVTAREMVYKCIWVLGTDLCWDYGHQFDIPRPTPSKANLSFHFYKVQGRSKTSMMKPVIDQMQLGWLKLQNALAMAPPKGLAIEYSTLNNINIGGGTLKPLEVIKIYQQNGSFLYSATTNRGYSPTQSSYKPIQELEGGIGSQLTEFMVLFDKNLEIIRGITGINRIADASSPKGEDLVGVAQVAQAATVTALKPLYSAYTTIKERSCQNIAQRIQLLVKFNKVYEVGYHKVLGKAMTEALKIGSEIDNAMFGIRIVVRPSLQEKQTIMNAALESMKAGKNGYSGITMSDYLLINNFMDKGMVKFAQAYLSSRESEITAQQEQQKQAAIQQQNEGLAKIEQVKAQNEQTKIEAETQKSLRTIAAQGEEDRKTAAFEHQLELERMDKQTILDIQKEALKPEGNNVANQ